MASTTSNRLPPEEIAVRKEKAEQEKLLKHFKKAWEVKSPKINVSSYIKNYDALSDEYSRPILENILRVLAVVNAVEFANETLEDKFHAQGVAVQPEEITVLATRMVKIKTVEMLCEMFEMDSSYVERIMSLAITREFGSIAPTLTAPPIGKSNQVFRRVQNVQKQKESVFTKKRKKVDLQKALKSRRGG